MKVLLMVNEFPPEVIAGTACASASLARHLARRGHEVHIAVTTRGPRLPALERQEAVRVYRLRPLRFKGTRSLQRLLRLYQLARSVAPDVIQGQSVSCGAFAALIGRALQTPSVACIQGFDLYHAGALQRRTELQVALRLAERVVAVTEDLKLKAAALSGRRDITVIPHGVDLHDGIEAEAERLRRAMPELVGRRVLLYAGQLQARKGLTELLAAMGRVGATAPESVLLLAGQGPLEGRLRQQVRSEGLEGEVRFLGLLPHRRLLALMRLADAFVLPSRDEPFGIVLIEAMSQGLPIAATAVRSIPLLIREGVNGYLSAPGDVDGLAGSLIRLIQRPEEAAAIGRRNRAQAERFDWRRLVVDYEHIYAALSQTPRCAVS